MSRQTAITEEISYDVEECHICGEEVVTEDVPEDIMAHRGFAVLLGEGTVSHESEDAGNWDNEFRFELTENDSGLPSVEGYVICELCAASLHNHPSKKEHFTGKIPQTLQRVPNTAQAIDSNIEDSSLIYWVAAVAILLLVLIFFL